MKNHLPLAFLFGLSLAVRAVAADAPPAPDKTPSMKDEIKALLIEDAKNAPPAPVAKPVAPEVKPAAPVPAPADPKKTAAKADLKVPEGPTTSLPGMEVRKSRITELDLQLREKDKEIARETKNTKSSDLDKTVNNPKLAKALSIFGGTSNEFKESVAQERVSLLEAERDLLEEIAHAKTKAEKEDLQKQLDDLKSMRRDLERTMR